jgi:hypothetical protein
MKVSALVGIASIVAAKTAVLRAAPLGCILASIGRDATKN